MVLLQAWAEKALRDLCARARPDDFGAGDAVATAAPGPPVPDRRARGGAVLGVRVVARGPAPRLSAAAFALAAGRDVATPLLGAGARGAPVADAAAAARALPPPRRRHRFRQRRGARSRLSSTTRPSARSSACA